MKKYIKTIFKSFTSKEQNDEAKAAFHSWLIDENHQSEKEEELQAIWNEKPITTVSDTWEALDKIKSKLGINKRTKNIWVWQSIAATLVLISSTLLYLLLNNSGHINTDIIELHTPIAQLNTITLPDGTIVHSNSKTTLLYPSEFTGETRSVYLVGEAMFKVAKDEKHPFIVKTSNVNVTALGTEFNVAAYPEDSIVYTTLLSGSIEVEAPKSKFKKILTPNEQLAYQKDGNNYILSQVQPNIITAWKDGEITIQNKTLKETFAILERYYATSIQYDWKTLNTEYRYTFKFRRDAPFEEVARVIKTVSNINYKLENNICYIY